jgi:REP element-mobilizing transposase RayT
MTAPRQILPGSTSLVTRRCTQRQYLLRPCAEVTQLFGFLLAVAAERFHVDVHAVCVMSNHVHLVVTDREARLPAFNRFLGSLVARSMNALLDRSENFWAPSRTSLVVLQTPADILDKMAYVLANPVAAGLVRRGRQWPGLWSDPARVGADAIEFKRPGWFFRKKGKTALPDAARLRLVPPPGLGSVEQVRREVVSALESLERQAAADLAAARREFLGVRRVLAQQPFGTPPRSEPRRGLNPRIACRDPERRALALRQLVAFLRDYRCAFQRWRERAAPVVFPYGTYLMRVLHGATCAAPG